MAITVFPIASSLTIQFFAQLSMAPKLRFLPFFANVHHCVKKVIYTTLEFLKRSPLCAISPVRYESFVVRQFLLAHKYFYMECLRWNTLRWQWLIFWTTLLHGDAKMNLGPETIDFCTWNLNIITAYDFSRVSLIDAFNSVYKHDLSRIIRTYPESM